MIFGTDLIYKTGSTIEDISTRIYICLYTGIVVMIKVFDQDFCLVEDLKIGIPITNKIIENMVYMKMILLKMKDIMSQ